MAGSRPFGVTLVGVIILISGVLGLVSGILGVFNREPGMGFWAAIALIVVSVIYLLVAKGLFNGSSGARFLVAIVTVVSLIAGLWQLIAVADLRLYGAAQALVAIIVLALLYSEKSKAFFR